MLNINARAPDFSLRDQDGIIRVLSDYAGRYVLMYFYPKDDTPGCTKEACGIRDAWDEYTKRGIVVLGISKDSVASHKKFQEKYNLPFMLLSDEGREVIRAYGADNEGSARRISYLVSPDGMILKTYPKVDPALHAPEILRDVDAVSAPQL